MHVLAPLSTSTTSMTVTIDEAIKAYFAERAPELSESSITNHRYLLKQFREWAEPRRDVDNIDDIEPLTVSRFRRHRSESINSNTMYNQLSVLRLFLRFCDRMGWVGEEVPRSVSMPTRAGCARTTTLDPDRIGNILDDLERYEYASLDHLLLSLTWTASLRIGALRALDVDDVHLDDQWINIAHRPSEGTPLKNKDQSEREVNLHGWVCDVLRAWIDDRRPDVVDDNGRSPLVASQYGRMTRSPIRTHIYKLTSCGSISTGCECGASSPSKCKESVSPHAIRRASITAWLDKGTKPELLSSRVDSSTDTLEKHYDVRSAADKRELRRDAFDM